MPEPLTSEKWERAKEIFEAALEQLPEHRAAFVVEACQGDNQLKAEVENLLVGDARADATFLNAPTMPVLFSGWPITQPIFRVHQVIARRFEILRFIGRGGMGEVYEAKDLDLGERVALKAIRPEFSSDPVMLKRFRHELQLARRVTHPNVCRLYHLESFSLPSGETGDAGAGIAFITMELLEGETLENRLRRCGRMRPEEAISLGRQMSAGLAAAHHAGVIHRDFKPGNVMLVPEKPSGAEALVLSDQTTQSLEQAPIEPRAMQFPLRAVVTDFGLAKALEAAASIHNGSSSLTAARRIIGTPAYMAPEQLEAREVTPATDVYALGLVLYEMLTGQQPFPGNPYDRLREPAPRGLAHVSGLQQNWEAVILRCIEINPVRRFPSALEVESALSKVRRVQPIIRFSLAALAVVLALAGIALGVLWLTKRPARPPRLDLVPLTTDPGLTWEPTLSADGKLLAFSSDRGGTGDLESGTGNLEIWTQFVSGGTPIQATHTKADEVDPALSPDGSKVVYRSERDGGGIYVSSSTGGDERLIVKFGRSPRFSPVDGSQIVYWTGDENNISLPTGKIYVIPAQGGVPTQLQPGFADARYPVWGPDGRHILFAGSRSPSSPVQLVNDWWVTGTEGGEAIPTQSLERLRRDGLSLYGCAPYWTGDGVIFSARSAGSINLWQIPLSSGWRASGAPRRLTLGSAEDTSPWIADHGRLVFSNLRATASVYELPTYEGLDKNTSALKQLTSTSALDIRPSISADGKRLVFARRSGAVRNIWLRDLQTGSEKQVTSSTPAFAVISRDGSRIAYSTEDHGKIPIYTVSLESEMTERVCEDCGEVLDWSPDGQHVLFLSGRPTSISALDLKSQQALAVLNARNSSLDQAQISSDGRWLVFVSRLDGDHSRILLSPMQGMSASDSHWIPLTDGQTWDDKPRWSEDGRTIFFYSTRDGFGCIWKIRLDPATRTPTGTPSPVRHFHSTRLSMIELLEWSINLSVGGGKLVFSLAETTGNIWMTTIDRE
jgi:serine/threonine protein kinase